MSTEVDFFDSVASFLGSGINGNNIIEKTLTILISVASFLGSGINGNSTCKAPGKMKPPSASLPF